jgi:hypothetical protein
MLQKDVMQKLNTYWRHLVNGQWKHHEKLKQKARLRKVLGLCFVLH